METPHENRVEQIKALAEALHRSVVKHRAYVGICKDDKELTGAIIPMLDEALTHAPAILKWCEEMERKAMINAPVKNFNLERLQNQNPISTKTYTIDENNLPKGPHWDIQGACYTAEKVDPAMFDGSTWAWMPRNLRAIAKGYDGQELFPFIMPTPPESEA